MMFSAGCNTHQITEPKEETINKEMTSRREKITFRSTRRCVGNTSWRQYSSTPPRSSCRRPVISSTCVFNHHVRTPRQNEPATEPSREDTGKMNQRHTYPLIMMPSLTDF